MHHGDAGFGAFHAGQWLVGWLQYHESDGHGVVPASQGSLPVGTTVPHAASATVPRQAMPNAAVAIGSR